jgi:hypothetical protein
MVHCFILVINSILIRLIIKIKPMVIIIDRLEI